MMVRDISQIIILIEQDEWMMEILKTAQSLQLPDWWICAGFVRTKIWDTLSENSDRTPLDDIDVVYFDPTDLKEETEKEFEKVLQLLLPHVPWSVKNEARMHTVNGASPYTSTEDAISKFPETATALGVTITDQGKVLLTAPWGVGDVMSFKVKPTPYFRENKKIASIYEERIRKKSWKTNWPKVTFEHIEVD
ncbi:nucleotidyltransferase family protein [Bacillus suaedaesalsae]|uniref:nucleotidyltransferase family protein n=1 Tax=Bacillus suaedaesalsae TaxID=2810349 RepID=UPI003D27A600